MTPSYESYVEQYREKQNKLTAKGLQMYDRMYTEREFDMVYKAIRNDRREMVANGELRSIGNITREVVTRQAYELSYKQGKSSAEYARRTGQKLTQQQIRAGQVDWSALREYQEELEEQGLSSYEISEEIATLLFGSP